MDWISVEDRFPTKEEIELGILVYFNYFDLMGVQPKNCLIGKCDPYEYNGPSHWMHAPKPPKDE